MIGRVDGAGRALVRVMLHVSPADPPVEVDAWVDTGFTGELVPPLEQIVQSGLPFSAFVKAELGDGTETVLESYSCLLDWFDELKPIEVLASAGGLPLLGVGLLLPRRLTVDYRAGTVTIE